MGNAAGPGYSRVTTAGTGTETDSAGTDTGTDGAETGAGTMDDDGPEGAKYKFNILAR